MNGMQRIVVLGGTGFVGRAVVARLVQRNGGGGGRIVVPTRRLSHGAALRSLPTVELVQADVHDESQLARLVAGADAVIQLVAILHGSEGEFRRVHVELPRRLAQACASTGVRRVVHVSALGIGPDAPSRYLRSKAEGEAVLKAAGLELTVLRPSVIFGAEDRLLNLFAAMQRLLPVIPLAGSAARFQPVWVEDVARAIVGALDRPETIGRTYECAGPREYTLADLVRAAGRAAGCERPVLPLPEAVGRVQAALMELAPGTPLMSRDNIDSMRVPNVASGTLPGLAALGIVPTALEAVAPEYLGPRQGCARFDRWRAGARRA